MSEINNRRTRIAVAICNWILRTIAPEYGRVLNRMTQREMYRAFYAAEIKETDQR